MIGGDGNEANSPQEILRKSMTNMLMDFLYKQIKSGLTNTQINKKLKQRRMPKLEPEKLNGLRTWFKQAEHYKPEAVARIKRRIFRT